MKKLVFLFFLLPAIACKKNGSTPGNATPNITQSLSVSIVNQNPDKYDSATGHVHDTFSWSVPNAYADTGYLISGNFISPPNAPYLMLESLIYGYGTGGAVVGESRLWVNNGTVFNGASLIIAFPDDTSNSILGWQHTGFTGGNITFADTVAMSRTELPGLTRMLNWWNGCALPINDTVSKYVNINTNELTLTAQDTLTFTSRAYVGDDLVVSGTFSEQLYTAIAFAYNGSFCRKTWYLKGTFSNMIYVFKPD